MGHLKPPPLPDLRRDRRVEVLAFVGLRRGAELLILTVKNISLGGVFLLTDGYELARLFPVDMVLELALFDASDDEATPVRARARVLRHAVVGMGMTWTHDAHRLSDLIERMPRR